MADSNHEIIELKLIEAELREKEAKLRLLFDAVNPEVTDVNTTAVWAAGELLRFDGNFNKFVQSRDLVKQEGIVFRHLLRLILLCGEFSQVTPADVTPNISRPSTICSSPISTRS